MEENKHVPDLERIDNPDVRHEHKDVNVRALLKFGLAFIVAGIVIHVLLWYVFGYFRGREAGDAPPPSVAVEVDEQRLPPEPRLQTAPVQDLAEVRAAEDDILEGYGWVDREAGTVRIPIERAMDLVVKEGLPARAPAPPQEQAR